MRDRAKRQVGLTSEFEMRNMLTRLETASPLGQMLIRHADYG